MRRCTMENKIYDCIIIGAGMAGMTAAIYLKRAELDILLLEKNMPGGQINQTGMIENYPGYHGDGPTLSMNTYEQVKENNIPLQFQNVTKIETTDYGFQIVAGDTKYSTKKIILATGRVPNKLALEKEEKLIGHGISYCAICDGPLFQDQVVAVIGSGNSALEEGLYLTTICKKVIFLNRSKQFKGAKTLVEKLEKLSNTEIHYQTSLHGLTEKDGRLNTLELKTENKNWSLQVDGLFVYIGFTPDTSYLNNLDITLDQHYIVVDELGKTSIPGIYACGDVVKKNYYQISTAVGDGANVALQVIKDLS